MPRLIPRFMLFRFPLQEYGMNYEAQPLQKHEIVSMKADPAIVERLKRSYQLMLGFYGMELVSDETGELRRAANWQGRFRNLAGECSMCGKLLRRMG